jgi:hypothetical protein
MRRQLPDSRRVSVYSAMPCAGRQVGKQVTVRCVHPYPQTYLRTCTPLLWRALRCRG